MKTNQCIRRGALSLGTLGLLALGVTGAKSLGTTPHLAIDSIDAIAANESPARPLSPQASASAAAARELSTAFREAADRVLPSVVTIETRMQAEEPLRSSGHERFFDDEQNPLRGTPWEGLFGSTPFGPGFRFETPPSRRAPQQGSGSGVIIDAAGLLMTNHHVVANAKPAEILVRLADGREFPATDVWTDAKTDIAIVKIDATGLPSVRFGNSDQVAVGDWVLALGQPFGLESSVTAGIISATHRGVGITARESFLQTDAAINPGNSGGPLVNLAGEVIGINTAISSRSGGNDGIGFAVPINLASWVGQQLAQSGTVHRAYLGVGIQPVTANIAQEFHAKPHEGVIVTEVRPDTPASAAGLQTGDVITNYAGRPIHSPQELQVIVESSPVGKPIELTIMRDGKAMELNFVPREQPANFEESSDSAAKETAPAPTSSTPLGIEVRDLDRDIARQLHVEGVTGVVITDVPANSAAASAGLEAGMVITQVNRQPIANMKEFERAMSKTEKNEGVLLLVKSSAGTRFVIVKP